jgi:hypothetical protein
LRFDVERVMWRTNVKEAVAIVAVDDADAAAAIPT